jgi:hypothetical protein
MLALGEFTYRELAQFSGVRETTVRSIISRNRGLLDSRQKTKSAERGHRGGPRHRLKLAEDQRQVLSSYLEEHYGVLQALVKGQRERNPAEDELTESHKTLAATLDWARDLASEAEAAPSTGERNVLLKDARRMVVTTKQLAAASLDPVRPDLKADIELVDDRVQSMLYPRTLPASAGVGIETIPDKMLDYMAEKVELVQACEPSDKREELRYDFARSFASRFGRVLGIEDVDAVRHRVREELEREVRFPVPISSPEAIFAVGTSPETYGGEILIPPAKYRGKKERALMKKIPRELVTFAGA